MLSIIYNCEIFRIIVLVAEISEFLMKGGLSAFGWYLKIFCFEIKALTEQVSESVHLLNIGKHLSLT